MVFTKSVHRKAKLLWKLFVTTVNATVSENIVLLLHTVFLLHIVVIIVSPSIPGAAIMFVLIVYVGVGAVTKLFRSWLAIHEVLGILVIRHIWFEYVDKGSSLVGEAREARQWRSLIWNSKASKSSSEPVGLSPTGSILE